MADVAERECRGSQEQKWEIGLMVREVEQCQPLELEVNIGEQDLSQTDSGGMPHWW